MHRLYARAGGGTARGVTPSRAVPPARHTTTIHATHDTPGKRALPARRGLQASPVRSKGFRDGALLSSGSVDNHGRSSGSRCCPRWGLMDG